MTAKVHAGHVGSFSSARTSMPQQPSGVFPAARLRLDGIVARCIAEQLRQPAESFSSRGRQFCLWGGPRGAFGRAGNYANFFWTKQRWSLRKPTREMREGEN